MLVLLKDSHHCHGEHWPGGFPWRDQHFLGFWKEVLVFVKTFFLRSLSHWTSRGTIHNVTSSCKFGLDEGIRRKMEQEIDRWRLPLKKETNKHLHVQALCGSWKATELQWISGCFPSRERDSRIPSNSWCSFSKASMWYGLCMSLFSSQLDFNHDQWLQCSYDSYFNQLKSNILWRL